MKKNKNSILSSNVSFSFLGRISLRDKTMLASNLAIMLKSGLAITESLDILVDQSTGKFRRIIQSISQSVMAGNSLSSSFAKFPKIFSAFFINAIQAGESSGNLENNLSNVAKQLTKEKELIDKIKGAMFYPLIILILAFVIGIALAFFVLPKITPIFTALKVDLPITTRFLIWFSDLIQNYGFIMIAILVGFIIFAIWLTRQKFFKPVSHFLFLRLPIISKLSRYKNISQFCRTLGTLLRSGLSLDEALQITEKTVSNYYYKKSIAEIGGRISQGGTLSENLAEYSKYFPRLAISMIRVGEKSGSLEEEFFNLANIYETEVDNTAKTLSTAVEPILLIIIGVIVGGLALSIITPIYKITGSVYR